MSEEMIREDDEIELMDLFLVLWRRKWIIIGIVSLSMSMAVLFSTVLQKKELKTGMTISLGFEGINKGLYPDGTTFDSKDIVPPGALSRMGLGIDFSGNVFVEDVIPGYVKNMIKKKPTFVYYPDKFKIILLEDGGDNLFTSNNERIDLLKKIVEEFKAGFQKRFIEEPSVSFKLPDDFIQTNEYDEITIFLEKNIDLANAFLMQKQKSVGTFRSRENGYSFSEAIIELSVLKDINLKKAVSKIHNFALSRDKQGLIVRIEDEIKNLEYTKLANEKLAKLPLDLLQKLGEINIPIQGESPVSPEHSTTQLLIDQSMVTELDKKNYLFYLIQNNIKASTRIINNSMAIVRLKDRLEFLKKNEENSDDIIEEQLRFIQNKISEIVQKAMTLNLEYLESQFSDSIRIISSSNKINYQYSKPKLILLLTFVGSLFFSVFVSFFADYIIRYRKHS